MKFKKMTITFENENNFNYQELIDTIKEAFSFPSFFGTNLNALIEGFSALRYPEETFANFYLNDDEILLLKLKNASSLKFELVHFLVLAIESANSDLNDKGLPPSIYLLVT